MLLCSPRQNQQRSLSLLRIRRRTPPSASVRIWAATRAAASSARSMQLFWRGRGYLLGPPVGRIRRPALAVLYRSEIWSLRNAKDISRDQAFLQRRDASRRQNLAARTVSCTSIATCWSGSGPACWSRAIVIAESEWAARKSSWQRVEIVAQCRVASWMASSPSNACASAGPLP